MSTTPRCDALAETPVNRKSRASWEYLARQLERDLYRAQVTLTKIATYSQRGPVAAAQLSAIAAAAIAEPKGWEMSDTAREVLVPCPFCGGAARDIYGFVGCEPCAIVRRDADSWNRRALRHEAREGYVLVPVEPTEAMLQAGYDVQVNEWPDDWEKDGTTPELWIAKIVYVAMLRAAEPKERGE